MSLSQLFLMGSTRQCHISVIKLRKRLRRGGLGQYSRKKTAGNC